MMNVQSIIHSSCGHIYYSHDSAFAIYLNYDMI